MFRWLDRVLMLSIDDPRCQPAAYLHNGLRMIHVLANDRKQNTVRVEDCYTGVEEDLSPWAITHDGWELVPRPVPA